MTRHSRLRIGGAWAFALVLVFTPGATHAQDKPDARALGIPLSGAPGVNNAITDVAGVEVGHTTLISGSGALKVGTGPVRTGITAILPRGRANADSTFAAWFTLNGNGEMTGTTWIREGGILETPILITNTHSVGVARDALLSWMLRHRPSFLWGLPVVAETWDGALNDLNGFHVKPEHVFAALDSARGGPVLQGSVGGGTGMICNGFKGGIGSASRVLPQSAGGFTVGVLVQCNYGGRTGLRIAGVPVGTLVTDAPVCYTTTVAPDSVRGQVPLCASAGAKSPSLREDLGSIIIVVATDAPLLPHQLDRLIKRASLGIGRMGGIASNGSGDIFIAFSTANRAAVAEPAKVVPTDMLPNDRINPLFEATVQATEEAIINAMLAAQDMVGINDLRMPALPEARVREIMQEYHGMMDRRGSNRNR
jgi:L-aminopeptidase/D-esterase-like protein